MKNVHNVGIKFFVCEFNMCDFMSKSLAETKRHYEAELKRKDAEIEKFRNELNDMMRVLKSLKRRRRRRG